jgi:phosphonopyruvate decarboxylase
MTQSKDFISFLKSLKLSDFLMVPCSIFKPLTSCLLSNEQLILPPNEAHAVGFAVGSFSVNNEPAVIFLQNSGLNNISNAITSLHSLYKIPMILIVSWRGKPGENDAPEHKIMGKILKKYFYLLDIPFKILSKNWKNELKEMVKLAKIKKQTVALIVKNGFFAEEKYNPGNSSNKYPLSRFEAIKIVKMTFKNNALFISTNGFISRESFSVVNSPDFYMMGSMGHAFSIGTGVAYNLTKKNSKLKTVIFDGDGGCLMHLGSLALVGLKNIKESNLIYIVLDNEAYESTGSQPSLSTGIDFVEIAKGLGFPQTFFVKEAQELKETIKKIKPNLASFIHIKINRGKINTSRVSDKYTCEQITKRFKKNFINL